MQSGFISCQVDILEGNEQVWFPRISPIRKYIYELQSMKKANAMIKVSRIYPFLYPQSLVQCWQHTHSKIYVVSRNESFKWLNSHWLFFPLSHFSYLYSPGLQNEQVNNKQSFAFCSFLFLCSFSALKPESMQFFFLELLFLLDIIG